MVNFLFGFFLCFSIISILFIICIIRNYIIISNNINKKKIETDSLIKEIDTDFYTKKDIRSMLKR